MTAREKIDQALGVSCGKSVDEMLGELDIQAEEFHKAFDGIDDSIKAEVAKIDAKAEELARSENGGALIMSDMDSSLRQIEGVIEQSKLVFQHIVANVTSSDLIDSELVHAAAALIESIHLNIAEFISIYKQKLKFVEKVKLMVFQQQQRIELAELKHRQNLELIEAKKKEPEAVEAREGEFEFDTDSVIKRLSRPEQQESVQLPQNDIGFDEIAPLDDEDDEDGDEDEDGADGKPKKKKK